MEEGSSAVKPLWARKANERLRSHRPKSKSVQRSERLPKGGLQRMFDELYESGDAASKRGRNRHTKVTLQRDVPAKLVEPSTHSLRSMRRMSPLRGDLSSSLTDGEFEVLGDFIMRIQKQIKMSKEVEPEQGSFKYLVNIPEKLLSTSSQLSQGSGRYIRCANSLSFSSDGRKLALVSESRDKEVLVLDTATGQLVEFHLMNRKSLMSIACLPNENNRYVSVSSDGLACIQDIQIRLPQRDIVWYIGPTELAAPLSLSPDGMMLASVSTNKTIKIWDTVTQRLLCTLDGHTESVTTTSFSPYFGRKLASGSLDQTIKIWDTSSGKLLQTLQGHTACICSLSFPSEGTMLASGSEDMTIKIWNTEDGTLLRSLQGHAESIVSIFFFEDVENGVLVSGSLDGTVKFWDVSTGLLLQTLEVGRGLMKLMMFSPDRTKIALVSQDGTFYISEITTEYKSLQYLRSPHSGRDLEILHSFPPHKEYNINVVPFPSSWKGTKSLSEMSTDSSAVSTEYDSEQARNTQGNPSTHRHPARPAHIGFQGQYKVLNQLSKSHFATTYPCVDKYSDANFMVKHFEKPSGESRLSIGFPWKEIRQEVAILMSITHPNILYLRSALDEEDAVYLVSELTPKGDLFDWIVLKKKLSEDESRKIFIQLFHAVKYLHEQGIAHRDIKPENILLKDENLTIKLTGFGQAKIASEWLLMTGLCGTKGYVAPEVLWERRYTLSIDVWSLGVVLYICLCGFPPFSDEVYTKEDPYTLSEQTKQGRFDYPSPYWDSVGDPALDLIDRMLTVDPNVRITVDKCLEHPWIRQRGPISNWPISPMDSTNKYFDFIKINDRQAATPASTELFGDSTKPPSNSSLLSGPTKPPSNSSLFGGPTKPPLNSSLLSGPTKPPLNSSLLNGPTKPPLNSSLLNGPTKPPSNSSLLSGPTKPPLNSSLLSGPTKPPSNSSLFGGPTKPPSNSSLFGGPTKPPLNSSLLSGPTKPPLNSSLLNSPTKPPSNSSLFNSPTKPPSNSSLLNSPTKPPSNSSLLNSPTKPPLNSSLFDSPTKPPLNSSLLNSPTKPPLNSSLLNSPTKPPSNSSSFRDSTKPPLNSSLLSGPTKPPSNSSSFRGSTKPPLNSSLLSGPTKPPSNSSLFGGPTKPPLNSSLLGGPTKPPLNSSLLSGPTKPPSDSSLFDIPTKPPSDSSLFDNPTKPPSNSSSFRDSTKPPSDSSLFDIPKKPPLNSSLFDGSTKPPSNSSSFRGSTKPPSDSSLFNIPTKRPSNSSLFSDSTKPLSISSFFSGPTKPPSNSSFFGISKKPPLNSSFFDSSTKPNSNSSLFNDPTKPPSDSSLFGSSTKPPSNSSLFGGSTKPPSNSSFFSSSTKPPSDSSLFGGPTKSTPDYDSGKDRLLTPASGGLFDGSTKPALVHDSGKIPLSIEGPNSLKNVFRSHVTGVENTTTIEDNLRRRETPLPPKIMDESYVPSISANPSVASDDSSSDIEYDHELMPYLQALESDDSPSKFEDDHELTADLQQIDFDEKLNLLNYLRQEAANRESLKDIKIEEQYASATELNIDQLIVSYFAKLSVASSDLAIDPSKEQRSLTVAYGVKENLRLRLKSWTRPFVPQNHTRISWICGCGSPMIADVQELRPGAARSMENSLRHSAKLAEVTATGDNGGGRSDYHNTATNQGPAKAPAAHSVTSRNSSTRIPGRTLPLLPNNQTNNNTEIVGANNGAADTSNAISVKYLLLCVDTKKSKQLEQIDISAVQNDHFLFEAMRNAYDSVRKPFQCRIREILACETLGLGNKMLAFLDFPFFEPKRGDFVKFLLRPERDAFCPSSLRAPSFPPENEVKENRTYEYQPCPVDIADIGASMDEAFIHCLFAPGPHFHRFWLDLFPKKLNSMLKYIDHNTVSDNAAIRNISGNSNSNVISYGDSSGQTFGWGIHIVEGYNLYTMTCVAVVIMVASGIVSILYSVFRDDVSAGFGIGSYLVALQTLVITLQFQKWQRKGG